jgi:hypothetical protein
MATLQLRLTEFRYMSSHIKINRTSAAEHSSNVSNLELTHLSEAASADWLLAENGSSRAEAGSVLVYIEPHQNPLNVTLRNVSNLEAPRLSEAARADWL